MKIIYGIAIATFSILSWGCEKHSDSAHSKSLIKKVTGLFHKSNNDKLEPLDLEFYKIFKSIPDEIKLPIWNLCNEEYIHDKTAKNYIIPFDQYVSKEFKEQNRRLYREHKDIYDRSKKNGTFGLLDENIRSNEIFLMWSFDGAGPNEHSSIYIDDPFDLKLIKIEDKKIQWKRDINLALKQKIYCVHPHQNQFIIGSSPCILTVKDNADFQQITTESQPIAVPDGLRSSFIRFGPGTTLFIANKERTFTSANNIEFYTGDDFIMQYDYQQKKSTNIIDIESLFNEFLSSNPQLHKQLYYSLNHGLHRQEWQRTDCYLINYSDIIRYSIDLEDFICPHLDAGYLLIKFNIKTPYCKCYSSAPYGRKYYILYDRDHYALYNINSKNFFYIGNKLYKVRGHGLARLPHFRTIKKSTEHTHVYNFPNYQSSGPYHTFCYDDELNTYYLNSKDNFPFRKMVAIVPDDDIARLEQMIIAGIAHSWCKQEKPPKTKGYEILRYLMSETKNLEIDQNPFKYKRVVLLHRLAEQMAQKLNIDLQEHIKKHLNEN